MQEEELPISCFHFPFPRVTPVPVCLSVCEPSTYCSPVFFLFSLFLSRIGVSLSPVKGFEMDGSRAHADEGERASYMSIIGREERPASSGYSATENNKLQIAHQLGSVVNTS